MALWLRKLLTMDRLASRVDLICKLCDLELEFIDHAFFCCPFSGWVIAKAFQATRVIVHMPTNPTFQLIVMGIKKLSNRTCVWGLQWSILAMVSWSMWKERNAKVKRKVKCTKEVIMKNCISMVGTAFKESCYKSLTRHDQRQSISQMGGLHNGNFRFSNTNYHIQLMLLNASV